MLSCTKIARVYFKHLIGPYGDKREDLFVIRLWILRVRSVQIFWREFFHIKKKKRNEEKISSFKIYSRILSHFLFHVSSRLSWILGFKVLVFEIINGSSDLYFFLYVVCFPGVLSVWSLESVRSMRRARDSSKGRDNERLKIRKTFLKNKV